MPTARRRLSPEDRRAELLALGLEPGVILDRLDAGRRVLLRALDSRHPPAGTLSELDDRLASIQHAARLGIDEAISADAAEIEASLA